MAWIFQPIDDIKNETLGRWHDGACDKSFSDLCKEYNERIKAEIDWELYFGYCCWRKDYLYNHEVEVKLDVHSLFPDVPMEKLDALWKKELKEWKKCNGI